MKKITLLLMFLYGLLGYSQDYRGKIQSYLESNKVKYDLSSQDVNDWIIESTGNSESTNIDTYWIKQRYQGIEIYNALSNVWIKNGTVINIENRFIPNIASKANTTSSSLNVLDGLQIAKTLLNIDHGTINHEVIEQEGSKIKISNGDLDPIIAQLVFQKTNDNKLRLSWNYIIDVAGHNHLWNVRLDAITKKIIAKEDMVISCSFNKNHKHSATCAVTENIFHSSEKLFKPENAVQTFGGSYRVIPFNYPSPNHSPRVLISNPENSIASPKGWHDTNNLISNNAASKYTYLRGNNTWTRADYGDVEPTTYSSTPTANGYSPDGTSALVFDFPYNGTFQAPTSYIDAATTNLFYMNNIMHDVWYQYGFNEANGNFQKDNYGKGGTININGDAVWSDAQDGSTKATPDLNNANFSTPADGSRPRMQMYLWTVGPSTLPLYINSPSDISGPREGRNNAFSPGNVPIPIAPNMIQANLVLYDDGSADAGQTDNADACGPAVNAAALAGKIAVIRRSLAEASGGTPCAFAEKVKNAQNAGAVAAIVVNNVPGIISMSGADATITIPAISVTQEVGEALIARIKTETVNGKLQLDSPPFVNSDGDLDNGIISHEYGHGISTRLAGGPNNSGCLGNYEAMGEGWSDWFGLMMQIKTGDVGTTPVPLATFVLSQPNNGPGLRQYPYTTNMSVNPLTFGDTNIAIPTDPADTSYRYVMGEFWATTLWDLTWAYINKYGFNSDIYAASSLAGNNRVMKLILDAIKLQPCSPSIIDGRNAIIAADQATTGGADFCLITEVFRRRGLGINASSGDGNNPNDQVENFVAYAPGPNCTALGTDAFDTKTNQIKVYPNPTNDILNIKFDYVGKVKISLTDLNGRNVFNSNEEFNMETTIKLPSLAKGLYILNVENDTIKHAEKIIIK